MIGTSTRMMTVPPRWRWGVLALVGVTMALLLAVMVSRTPAAVTGGVTAPAGDAVSYGRIIERMRSGEGYYLAAHEVLVADGYGTRSVFNWRMPAWPTILALLPPGGGQVLLGTLAVAGLVLTYRMLRGAGIAVAIVSVLAVALNFAAVLTPEAVVFSEVATGVLILLSVAAYGNGWRGLGLVAALLALFLRELAAPYVLISVLLSIREHQWREFAGWCGGLIAYAAYFGWHCWMVFSQLGPRDRAYGEGWVAWGGLDFVLATTGFNGLWALGPDWVPALLLPLGLLGLWAWPNRRALSAVAVYLAAFLVIGKPFNAYWGAIYTPVLMLGLGWMVLAVREVVSPRARAH